MDLLETLTETTQHVKAAITPLIKTPLAQKTYGKGAGGDPKKHIDVQAEKAIIETLVEHGLSFTLISEETGIKTYGQDPTAYVTTDPLDGTTNTLRGIPFACTSIAISKTPNLDTLQAAVVADLFHDATYLAQRNLGAYRNYQKIAPAKTDNLAEAIIGLDLNTYKATELTERLNQLLTQTKHIRHLGANALELCYVADGTTDAFIDLRGKLRTTDMAAATLIIQEAGGIITTPQNTPLTNPLSPTETVDFIAAGNTGLHQTILDTLRKAHTPC
jgi:myo-inositol-1(or 4)-monophosphatase